MPSYLCQTVRDPHLHVPPSRWIGVERVEMSEELARPRADLDCAFVQASSVQAVDQIPRRLRHLRAAQGFHERDVIVIREILGAEIAVSQRVLHSAQQHHHAGAIGVMPVDVVEHLLSRVDQRVERADPLLSHHDPTQAVDLRHA